MSLMRISDRGLELLKRSEGCKLTAYPDAGAWSIGYGCYGASEGEEITQERADELLLLKLSEVEAAIDRQATVPLTQGQFDALVCLGYNIGIGALKMSTLMRRVNEGDMTAAAAEFRRWNRSGGAVNPGLVARRQQERELFLS